MEKEIIQYLIQLNKELMLEVKKLNLKLKFVDKICKDVIEIKRILNNLNQDKPKTITNTEQEEKQEELQEETEMLSSITNTKEENEFILY